MNNEQAVDRVKQSMLKQIEERGYATVVDTLMDANVLTKQDYNNWRLGKIPYLERVCRTNLNKLDLILKTIHEFGEANKWKKSVSFYKQSGSKQKKALRFSKSGSDYMEKRYATHFVDGERIKALKK